jgi:hypothetical protein
MGGRLGIHCYKNAVVLKQSNRDQIPGTDSDHHLPRTDPTLSYDGEAPPTDWDVCRF